MTDTINPDHYKFGNMEAIDAMKAMSSREEFLGYLKLSAIKYQWRYRHKGSAMDDLRKAKWFLERLIKEETNESN